jgi:hypothetical protein
MADSMTSSTSPTMSPWRAIGSRSMRMSVKYVKSHVDS